jgi:hypothetical protein
LVKVEETFPASPEAAQIVQFIQSSRRGVISFA